MRKFTITEITDIQNDCLERLLATGEYTEWDSLNMQLLLTLIRANLVVFGVGEE